MEQSAINTAFTVYVIVSVLWYVQLRGWALEQAQITLDLARALKEVNDSIPRGDDE